LDTAVEMIQDKDTKVVRVKTVSRSDYAYHLTSQ